MPNQQDPFRGEAPHKKSQAHNPQERPWCLRGSRWQTLRRMGKRYSSRHPMAPWAPEPKRGVSTGAIRPPPAKHPATRRFPFLPPFTNPGSSSEGCSRPQAGLPVCGGPGQRAGSRVFAGGLRCGGASAGTPGNLTAPGRMEPQPGPAPQAWAWAGGYRLRLALVGHGVHVKESWVRCSRRSIERGGFEAHAVVLLA